MLHAQKLKLRRKQVLADKFSGTKIFQFKERGSLNFHSLKKLFRFEVVKQS